MAQFHDLPARYLEHMRAALPRYDRLQDELAAAGADLAVTRILDLGAGTGETSRRCLTRHAGAHVTAVDASAQMLELAAVALPGADLRLGRLEDPLPAGPFDLVVSALAVHHLRLAGKRDLFARIAQRLRPGGRLVMADVVVPAAPVPEPTPLDPAVDHPDALPALLGALVDAGLSPTVAWAEDDLAVVAAER